MLGTKILSKNTVGSWITIGHPMVAEIMSSVGFDWLTIDLEHSSISVSQAEELIRVITLKGVPTFVRTSSNNAEQIKRVLDFGASGIIVPMVNSALDAQQAVAAARYPPLGRRSFGLARAQKYGCGFLEYVEWEKDGNVCVVAQIEHIDAVENFEHIVSTEGIDGFLVGPYDLSGSLGIPGRFSDQRFLDAMAHINAVASQLQIPGGVHIVEPDVAQLRKTLEEGAEFVAFSLDSRILDVGCRVAKEILNGSA